MITQKALELSAALANACPKDNVTPEIEALRSGEFKASAGYIAKWKARFICDPCAIFALCYDFAILISFWLFHASGQW